MKQSQMKYIYRKRDNYLIFKKHLIFFVLICYLNSCNIIYNKSNNNKAFENINNNIYPNWIKNPYKGSFVLITKEIYVPEGPKPFYLPKKSKKSKKYKKI